MAGKEVEAKLATPLSSNNKQSNPKVFVGGINKTVTKDVLCEIFNKRGNVSELFLLVCIYIFNPCCHSHVYSL